MIPININVKESAYDKVIYFLSHLKDDVFIIDKDSEKDTSKTLKNKKLKQIKILDRLSTLDKLVTQSNNSVTVTRDLATNTDGMSDDISRY